MAGKDVYVNTVGFKSYAHLYYFKKQKPLNEKSYDDIWLLEGNIDKPAYFVTKINKKSKLEPYPEVKLIGEKGGFAFFKRDIK